MATRTIAIVGFDGISPVDLVGPAEVFAVATSAAIGWSGEPRYEVRVVSVGGLRFRGGSYANFQANCRIDALSEIDTLIVPGGSGLRRQSINRRLTTWIAENHFRIRRIASVCTGIHGLAPTGLLNGRRVATHWRFSDDVAKLYPGLHVVNDALYVKDGKFYTTAGVTAGIDLALSMVEEDHGRDVAHAVSRELVLNFRRSSDARQYSEALQVQERSRLGVGELVAWIQSNLHNDLSVEIMAARACLSPRQLTRIFSRRLGVAPAAYVSGARIAEAQRKLLSTDLSIDEIGRSLGYVSADVLSRSFIRHTGIPPTVFRRKFRSLEAI